MNAISEKRRVHRVRREANPKQQALTVAQSTFLTGLTERATWQAIYRGRFPYRRWNRKVVILRDELEMFLKRLDGVSVEEALERAGTER